MKWERATKFRLVKVKLLPLEKKDETGKDQPVSRELPQQFWKLEEWEKKKKKKKKGQSLSFNSENCKEPQADQRQSSKLVSHT